MPPFPRTRLTPPCAAGWFEGVGNARQRGLCGVLVAVLFGAWRDAAFKAPSLAVSLETIRSFARFLVRTCCTSTRAQTGEQIREVLLTREKRLVLFGVAHPRNCSICRRHACYHANEAHPNDPTLRQKRVDFVAPCRRSPGSLELSVESTSPPGRGKGLRPTPPSQSQNRST
eukprot:scaffold1605_cov365-Pavlova_lutheri.AAC.10